MRRGDCDDLTNLIQKFKQSAPRCALFPSSVCKGLEICPHPIPIQSINIMASISDPTKLIQMFNVGNIQAKDPWFHLQFAKGWTFFRMSPVMPVLQSILINIKIIPSISNPTKLIQMFNVEHVQAKGPSFHLWSAKGLGKSKRFSCGPLPRKIDHQIESRSILIFPNLHLCIKPISIHHYIMGCL